METKKTVRKQSFLFLIPMWTRQELNITCSIRVVYILSPDVTKYLTTLSIPDESNFVLRWTGIFHYMNGTLLAATARSLQFPRPLLWCSLVIR